MQSMHMQSLLGSTTTNTITITIVILFCLSYCSQTVHAQPEPICTAIAVCGSCAIKKNEFNGYMCRWCRNSTTCVGIADTVSKCNTNADYEYVETASDCSSVSAADLKIIVIVGAILGALVAFGTCYYFYAQKKRAALARQIRRAEAREQRRTKAVEAEMVTAQRSHAATVSQPSHVQTTTGPSREPSGDTYVDPRDKFFAEQKAGAHKVQFHGRGKREAGSPSASPQPTRAAAPSQAHASPQQQHRHASHAPAPAPAAHVHAAATPPPAVVVAPSDVAVFVPFDAPAHHTPQPIVIIDGPSDPHAAGGVVFVPL